MFGSGLVGVAGVGVDGCEVVVVVASACCDVEEVVDLVCAFASAYVADACVSFEDALTCGGPAWR